MTTKELSTIDNIEIINLQPVEVNPLMSLCEIKVCYLGENRIHTVITKEVATEMAKTLRGVPIVGNFREEDKDFTNHAGRVVIDEEKEIIYFVRDTRPYGFVPPDAKVWFQDYETVDEFGNIEIKTYLMTNGYLWTGLYKEELRSFKDSKKAMSMELDNDTIQGDWVKDFNSFIDFFIINDAKFSKLCILGDNVEPVFEDAGIELVEYSMMDNKFTKTLYSMMQDLDKVLNKGANKMPEDKKDLEQKEQEVQVQDTSVTEYSASDEKEKNADAAQETKDESKEDKSGSEDKADAAEDKKDTKDDKEEDKEKKDEKDKYSLLDQTNAELQAKVEEMDSTIQSLRSKISMLEAANAELSQFKVSVEDRQKTEMINQFSLLTDEEKKDVIENKAQYSLDEIESKLSVIESRKRRQQEKEEVKEEVKPDVMTYSLNDGVEAEPAWIKAIKAVTE